MNPRFDGSGCRLPCCELRRGERSGRASDGRRAPSAHAGAAGGGGDRHRRSGRRCAGQTGGNRLAGLGRAPRARDPCCRAAQAFSRRSRSGAPQDCASARLQGCSSVDHGAEWPLEGIPMRMFFALWPDADVRALIAGAAAALCSRRGAAGAAGELSFDAGVRRRSCRIPASRCCSRSAALSGSLPARISLDAYEHWPEPRVVVAVARETPAALIELSGTPSWRGAVGPILPNAPPRRCVRMSRWRGRSRKPLCCKQCPPSSGMRKAFSLVSSDTQRPHIPSIQ